MAKCLLPARTCRYKAYKQPRIKNSKMIQSPSAIIATVGLLLVLAGLSMHSVARITSAVGAVIAPVAGTKVVQPMVDLVQANWFVGVGVSVAILAGVIWVWGRR